MFYLFCFHLINSVFLHPAFVPDSVRAEMLQRIRSFLASTTWCGRNLYKQALGGKNTYTYIISSGVGGTRWDEQPIEISWRINGSYNRWLQVDILQYNVVITNGTSKLLLACWWSIKLILLIIVSKVVISG